MFKKIAKLCKERGITVTALENELGLGRCTISKWGSTSSPTVNNLKKVADYFGASIDDLLNDTTE